MATRSKLEMRACLVQAWHLLWRQIALAGLCSSQLAQDILAQEGQRNVGRLEPQGQRMGQNFNESVLGSVAQPKERGE
jgi:hypothetical protein